MKNIIHFDQFLNESEITIEEQALEMVEKSLYGNKGMLEIARKNPEYSNQNLQLSVPILENAQKLYKFFAKATGIISPESTKQLLTLAKLGWEDATLGKIIDVYGKILEQIKKECEAKIADKNTGPESKAAIDHKHIQLGMPKPL